MFAWCLLGLSLARSPSHGGMSRSQQGGAGDLGWGQRAPGSCVPALGMSPLYVVWHHHANRASTLEEGQTAFFFSFVVDWGEQGETPSRRMGSSDRSQQQSWLLAPVLNEAEDSGFSFWKDGACGGGPAFICSCLWALLTSFHGTKLLGDC